MGEFLDVLTGARIRDVVRAADGKLYDRDSLSAWFEAREATGKPIASPVTGEPMEKTLTVDEDASMRLAELLEDLEMDDPDGSAVVSKLATLRQVSKDVEVKTLASLRQVFDALDPLGDMLSTALKDWTVRRRS
jgi:hypothetical protein